MKIVNKVGLEGEFILRDSKGNLRFPAKHGFFSDEFFLLGEFRAEPGETREQTVGNYMAALSEVMYKANKIGFVLDFSGVSEITPELKADILRKMGSKAVPECKNIYGIDIMKLSDDVVENGTIVTSRVSAGLHVHFSHWASHTWMEEKIQKEAHLNLMTPSKRRGIIVGMDKKVLPNYDLGIPLKYRKAGFYEEKPYGFEYRSLPMVSQFTDIHKIMEVVDVAFSLLENLAK